MAGILLGFQAAEGPDKDLRPNGKGVGTLQHPPMPEQSVGLPKAGPGGGPKSTDNGINYHGGPLMTSQTHIYYIWYGNWAGNTASTILSTLAQNIGASPYYRINTTYTNGAGVPVSTDVVYNGSTAVTNNTDGTYRYGKSLSDGQIRQIVLDAISGPFPQDDNGVYFVLTSADVTASSGFCTQYCGWHTYSTMSVGGTSKVIKYAFIGNPDRCPSACAAQTTSPNGNVGADAMASIIAHELEEAATDPQLNAWYDRRGYENADKCAWTFGSTLPAANGSLYNMTLGGLNFLIQRNWVNAGGGYCALSY